jgi:hypothetical protein
VTFIDSSAEHDRRGGERLSPTAADPLAWATSSACDGVSTAAMTAGAPGPPASWRPTPGWAWLDPAMGLQLDAPD